MSLMHGYPISNSSHSQASWHEARDSHFLSRPHPPPVDLNATKVSARGPTKAPRALDHGIVTKAVQQE
jgi:hypothetical protein